jgi:hypothetical protein
MMIRKKSPEEMYAQIAVFARQFPETDPADEQGCNKYRPTRRDYILNNMVRCAFEPPADEVITFQQEDNTYDIRNDGMLSTYRGMQLPASREFRKFIKTAGNLHGNNPQITKRIELQEAYSDFAPFVDQLVVELRELFERDSRSYPKSHANYLGEGAGSCVAFGVQVDGRGYAVRLANSGYYRENTTISDDYVEALINGIGIEHIEQIVAVKYDGEGFPGRSVVVSELMPGKSVCDLTVDEIDQMPQTHLYQLVDTIIEMSEHNLCPDTLGTNIFYDKENGFGIVDYKSGESDLAEHLGRGLAKTFSDDFQDYLFLEKGYDRSTEDYGHALEYAIASLRIIQKYREAVACNTKLGEDDKEKTLTFIDEKIKSCEDMVSNMSDPAWVAKEIAEYAERAKMYARLGGSGLGKFGRLFGGR